MSTLTNPCRETAIRDLADALGKDGEIEFDDDAKISEGDDNGAYVQAWVWVSFEGTTLDKEPDVAASYITL